MGGQEAKACVMEIKSDADSALVSGHAPQPCFSGRGLYITDRAEKRRFDEENQSSSNELLRSKQCVARLFVWSTF